MKTWILYFRFTEPEEGCGHIFVNINTVQLRAITDPLKWLNKKAGQESGFTLAYWEKPIPTEPTYRSVKYKEALNQIILESRYNETEVQGEHYGEKHLLLEQRLKQRVKEG